MVLISSKKYACETCIKGHRSSACKHTDRPLFEIKKKGRPVTQCEHCRELRKTKQVHVKCICEAKEPTSPIDPAVPKKKGTPTLPPHAAFPHGVPVSDAEPATAIASEDSDHGGLGCRCNELGGACHCCTPRARPSRRRSPPSNSNSNGNGGSPSTNTLPNPNHPNSPISNNSIPHTTPSPTIPSPSPSASGRTPSHHILARIAELRPVLPRPSARDVLLAGQGQPQHDLFHHHPSHLPPHHTEHFSPYGRAHDLALAGGVASFYAHDTLALSTESLRSAGTSASVGAKSTKSQKSTSAGQGAMGSKSPSPKGHSTNASFDGVQSQGFFPPPMEWRLPPSLTRYPRPPSADDEGAAYARSADEDVSPGNSGSATYPFRSRSESGGGCCAPPSHLRSRSDDEIVSPRTDAFPPHPRARSDGASDFPPRARSDGAPDFGGAGPVRTCGCGDGCACPGCSLHADNTPNGQPSCAAPTSCGSACLDCTILSLPDFSSIVGFTTGGANGNGGGGGGGGLFQYADSTGGGEMEYERHDEGKGPQLEYDHLELGIKYEPVDNLELGGYSSEGGAFALGADADTDAEQQARAIDDWIREVSALPALPPFEFGDARGGGGGVFDDPPFGRGDTLFAGDAQFGQPAWGAVQLFGMEGDTVAPVAGLTPATGVSVGDSVQFLTVPGPGVHGRSRSSSSASSDGSALGVGTGALGLGGGLAGLSLDPRSQQPSPGGSPTPGPATTRGLFPPPAYMEEPMHLF